MSGNAWRDILWIDLFELKEKRRIQILCLQASKHIRCDVVILNFVSKVENLKMLQSINFNLLAFIIYLQTNLFSPYKYKFKIENVHLMLNFKKSEVHH